MKLKNIDDSIKYSIIVISKDTITHLSKCVESLYRYTNDFELIIVDNASTDGSQGYIENLLCIKKNVKFIRNDSNMNFGVANNQGISIAEGKNIILLNSDTIVSPSWAERLEECLNHQENIAIVGPVSNMSNGRQNIPNYFKEFEQKNNYLSIESACVAWANAQKNRFVRAGVIYGWCMMVSRQFLADEPFLFDPIFRNAYEDNDLCLRASRRGWKLFIHYGTMIYHEGQASFKKEYSNDFVSNYMKNGVEMQDKFFEKYKTKKKPKLIAVYRIANCEKYIAKSLERTQEFADEIVCLLARSKDNTERIVSSFPKVTKIEVWNEPEHPFDEQAERDWLLQEAIRRGADWIISIDGDEVYEQKFVEMVPELIRPKNPHVDGYWCNWRTIWDSIDGVEKYRADSTFGAFQNYRFFRVLPGMKIESNRNIYNHHCGSAPIIPPENLKWLNVRVKHLGYDTEEQRMTKYRFYRNADPHPVKEDVGNSDYHHLIERNVMLKTWRENNRLSVMTVCKNEENFIYKMMQNIEPIADEFVVVDTGSTDGTLKEVERFARNHSVPVRIFEEKFTSDDDGMLMNYSEAKNFGKSKCRFEWILNMDADELFEDSKIGTLYGMLDEDCDAFLFRAINYLEPPKSSRPEENCYAISDTIRLYRNIPELFYTGLIHESIEDTVSQRVRNRRGTLINSPVEIHHRGFLKEKSYVKAKVERYHKINQIQFEVSGEGDPRPLFNMALHYQNIGDLKSMLDCYERCINLDKTFWRARQNVAWYYLDEAKKLLKSIEGYAPKSYIERQPKVKALVDLMNGIDFGIKRIG